MAAQTRRPSVQSDWHAEYEELSTRDRKSSLEPPDLERLAKAAYLSGHDADSVDILARAHSRALETGDTKQAARSAFWLAFLLIGARSLAQAAGWAARARRLLEQDSHDCVECGYVMLPHALEQVAAGDLSGAEATFTAAECIGERFTDADLTSLARQGRGRTLVALGRVAEGVSLFDEVMVAVTAGEVTPIVSGVVYCSVISACFEMLDIRRATEWTDALSHWCEAQPGLVPYRGECLAHRAEVFRLRGRWPESRDEARRAYDTLLASNGHGQANAAYTLAELHRLRGEVLLRGEAWSGDPSVFKW